MARQMERDEFSDIITAMLSGGMRGYTEGRKSELELRKDIWKERLKQELNPPKYEPRTQEEALTFERAKAGIEKPQQLLQKTKTELQISDLQSKQEENERIKNLAGENIKASALDTINTIAEVKKGKKYFGALGQIPTINPWGYERKEWESNVNKLLSQKIVDLMNNMKQASKTGATGFGQLNRSELLLLQNASTALNKGLSPKQAMKYLDKMEDLAAKVYGGGGRPIIPMANEVSPSTSSGISREDAIAELKRRGAM